MTTAREGLLRQMVFLRVVEETLAELYPQGEMRTPTHFAIGQEAVAVGVCAALLPDDSVFSGHRCHAHYLAKGGSPEGMVAELFGRETGVCRGLGGSVHLHDKRAGVVASSAILGQTMAVAAGRALAFKLDGIRSVAVSFVGDACAEEGIFYETLNVAAVHKLPVLFVCENNGYSTHTPLAWRQPEGSAIVDRAKSFGIASEAVDGNDVLAVQAAAERAVQALRSVGGPAFLECRTYRWREHVGPEWDWDRGYRTKDEVDGWVARCPIQKLARVLIGEGILTKQQLEQFHMDERARVLQAVEAARAAAWPTMKELERWMDRP